MNVNENNSVFLTVAAWPNWKREMNVFLRSAEKQGTKVELSEQGESRNGSYRHKIIRLRQMFLDWKTQQPHIRYIIYTDAKDVVFVKSRQSCWRRAMRLRGGGSVIFCHNLLTMVRKDMSPE